MPLNNTPANFTTFGNYTVWLNTVTDNLFWTFIGVIIPYVTLFMIFRRFGAIRAFVTTSYIMFLATWMLPLVFQNAAGVGLIAPQVILITFSMFLLSTALVLFVRE